MVWIKVGAALMFLGVSLGAFAAHALKTRLMPEMFAVFEVAVRYHIYHSLGILIIGVLSEMFMQTSFRWTGILFSGGILLFSGSLYLMTFTGFRWLGAITPLGGIAFLCGWALLALKTLTR